MPKKANKEKLLGWKKRLEESQVKMDLIAQMIEVVDAEHATIVSEMKEYGMGKDELK